MNTQDLMYTPTEPPARPFVVGDRVEVLSRDHEVLSEQSVKFVGKKHVKTTCGRSWTLDGEYFDGRRSYPFPTVRLKAQSTNT